MYRKSTIAWMAALIFLGVLCSTCTLDRKLLEGSWTKLFNDRPCTLTFNADNQWQVEYTGDSLRDAWGSYNLEDNRITLNSEGGKFFSDDPGTYTLSITETSVVFSLVSDESVERSTIIQGIWNRR